MTIEQTHASAELGTLLLAFYECLTDSDQIDTLMEMLTSWLDVEDAEVVSPKLDYHADRAWRLLGEFSEPEFHATTETDALEISQFVDASAVAAAVKDQILPDDLEKLKSWRPSETETTALLLRVIDAQSTELVILSHDPQTGKYLSKRTGPDFKNVISKFVADSFDLSYAELLLVQELLQGGTLREIAERLGKSWETTRSQVKTLTNKLGVNSQADVLRIINQAAALMPSDKKDASTPKHTMLGEIQRPDGRKIVYEIDGPPSDTTLVFIHGMIQGRHWPEKERRFATSRGWRVVRISRAGRGASSLNPKEKEPLLLDHVDDVMAVLNHEDIEKFSMFTTADGFALGYQIALRHPERVQKIVGLEVIPPILSRKVVDGFSGKMKTFGLACLYAPKTVKFMFGLAMHQMERMEDRYAGKHPLLGVELRKFEDADGIETDNRNFQDLMAYRAEGLWRDASYSCIDWAYAPENTNRRPHAALIHCADSMTKSPGHLDEFAHRIGAPIYRIDSYLPYISSALPVALKAFEQD